MAHHLRPLKDVPLVIAYPDSGRAVLHAEGCSHAARSEKIRQGSPYVRDTENVYRDDWYEVAPCAAQGKGLHCDGGGCGACEGHSGR